MMSESSAFAEKYGPWAIIAGASEGVGRELARKVAANGVSCILVARREKPLAELAEQIRAGVASSASPRASTWRRRMRSTGSSRPWGHAK